MKNIQNEKWVNALPDEAVKVAEEINIEIAKVIAERIKTIGELSPSDVKKLTNSLEYLGADFQKITKLIAKYSGKGQQAVVDTLEQVADANDDFAKTFYSAKGIAANTWHTDQYLNTLVEAMTRQTAAEFTNLSQTLAFKIDDRYLPLRQMYTKAIDKAIYEVQSGTVDYHTAMRKTVKDLATGLRVKDSALVVDKETGEVKLHWESGYSRRLDSHVRQNLIDGVKQLQAQMLDYHGEKFGSDGVELSAHAISAPDHAPVQGKQFSNEQFYRMQNGLPFEDINGNKYGSFPRPIGQWNCKHFTFPIIIGISKPAYTDEQLKEYERNSNAKYDLTQQQRAMETKLRKLKNERIAASAAGDEIEAKRIQRKINEQQTIYRRFSEKHNLFYDRKRASIEGYRRISVKANNNSFKSLQSISKDDIIPTVHRNNIVDAMKYANGNLKVDTYGYQNMSIEAANMVNTEIKKCFTIFGNLKNKGVLRAIKVVSDDKFSGVAAYNRVSKEVFLKNGYVGAINPKKEMLAISEKNYSVGFWSTGAPEHQIRHELGHAVEQMVDSMKLKKINSLREKIILDCNITKWSRQDKYHFAKAGKYISYYALETNGEFIAESIAEYLNGNPRNTAQTVINIILGVD